MDAQRAWNYCLWLLGRQAYTRATLQERLERKGAEPDVISATLDRLESYGFVDDVAFASQFVESRAARYGSLRLRGELLRRGVAEETVDGELRELDDSRQEEAAFQLLQRNAWRFRKTADAQRERSRAWAFLARRGFPPDAVSSAVARFAEAGGFPEETGAP